MAGCFVLAPKNAIPDGRIKRVNHAVYNGFIDWDTALKNINAKNNSKRVQYHTWDIVAIATLADYNKQFWNWYLKKPVPAGSLAQKRLNEQPDNTQQNPPL